MVYCVVFDLDGTLLETHIDIGVAANKALDEFGYSVREIEDYRKFIGGGTEQILRYALNNKNVCVLTFSKLIEKYLIYYGEAFTIHSRIYDGVQDLLVSLAEGGYLLAVLSNKIDAMTQKCVKYYFHNVNFGAVVGSNSAWKRKPSPDGLLLIANQIGVDRRNCVYIGDSKNDYVASFNAGVKFAGVSWGYEDLSCLEVKGVPVAKNPFELKNIITCF